jgi:sugar lactone lactonase YvrE
VALGGSGNIYVADSGNHTIREITPAGEVTTLAGSARFQGSTDGTNSTALFDTPSGVAVDNSGKVYVADTDNNTIRVISPSGMVTTLAGLPQHSGSVDGTNGTARFNAPLAVATDGSGNLYVADTGNGTIRMITPAGVVTTLAGSTLFDAPSGVTVDGSGNVYVADTDNDTIRKITPAGTVTVFAGSANAFGNFDGKGKAALFDEPLGMAVDASGNIFVADSLNYEIRMVTSAAVVTTLAGSGPVFGNADGTGSAARFDSPYGVAVDTNGNVYVADTLNQTIRKITPEGAVTTLAGLAATIGSADGTNSTARFYDPFAVAVDSSGNVYVTDNGNNTIRKITSAGVVTTLAGLAGSPGSADGTNSTARFNDSSGLAVDGSGNVYVADTGNQTIRKITPDGVVTTLAGSVGIYGSADGTNSTARFFAPFGVAVDSSGNVYVGDSGNQMIRKITPTGVVTTLAGLAGSIGGDDGTGSAALFDFPRGVAVDGSGNIFVADYYNYTIRKITPEGAVTTLAGLAQASGTDDGTGDTARFFFPNGVAVDSSGSVYVAEIDACDIRKGVPAAKAASLPLLGGMVVNNQIVFAWPTNYAGFTLQSSPNLGTAANWTSVTTNPPVQGSQFLVTNPISGGAQFFRLKR